MLSNQVMSNQSQKNRRLLNREAALIFMALVRGGSTRMAWFSDPEVREL